MTTQQADHPIRKVRVRVWRITWQRGSSEIYLTEDEARRVDSLALSDCIITEEIQEAIKA